MVMVASPNMRDCRARASVRLTVWRLSQELERLVAALERETREVKK